MSHVATDPIEALVELSRRVGSDPRMVLAGGGNTSVKVDDVLHVKASGASLASLSREGLVALDRRQLARLADADLGDDPDRREARYKAAIFDARLEPQRHQRPSVECLLHHLVPGRFVVHSHATLANVLTCCTRGREIAQELFGDDVLWLPYVDPGFTLARTLRDALAQHPRVPKAILMANHGLIVGGDDPDQIDTTTRTLLDAIAERLGPDWMREPFGKAMQRDGAAERINLIAPALRGLLADGERLPIVTFDDSEAAIALCGVEGGRAVAEAGPLTPDQIVYCNSFPLWLDVPDSSADASTIVDHLRKAVATHQQRAGHPPRVVLVRGLGLFAAGRDLGAARTAVEVYNDAIRVMAGASRLGAVQYLSDRDRRFIENWEVEAYRRQVAATAVGGPVASKIAVVTGAAQGFGLEIAQGLARAGAHVALTDINAEGARSAAAALSEQVGEGRAMGAFINVTDPASVRACLHEVVRRFGGIDLYVSNAGVLKAGSVKDQPLKDFQFVTDVNYTGYFVGVQAVAPIMATQHLAKPELWTDIIQINSKSGLQGSNRNGAYAGSKFGGIGLTQSFALELVEDGIKVNAICPGNFFDGPLWSDPERGLFVQYLKTGKVPGARTIADVKRFYEAKVPMGRGCTTADVLKAVFYLVEQKYETGQALPVTGGQVMLS